ncbi:MAG: cell division protein ZapA [Gammaproteobacteria bacterium]|nr:cell division protein ZapA [Gammaproteobacteria bacterium]MCY4227451.1 cell division protein ZapA [Gammaproteobacteria bacterium]MCY4312645.1 cell division protein ZapA [Gammaproteobacteria bacterium]
MRANKKTIKISIMKQQYSVSCEEEAVDNLMSAAHHLDRQMQNISESGKVLGIDRCAIMAGLNISNELLELKRKLEVHESTITRLRSLNEQLDKFVGDLKTT